MKKDLIIELAEGKEDLKEHQRGKRVLSSNRVCQEELNA